MDVVDGGVRTRASEVSSSSSTKRRKLDSGDVLQSSSLNFQLSNQSTCVVNSPSNSISQATSENSDQNPSSLCFSNDSVSERSRSLDLKVENSGTDISECGFSRETTPPMSEVICTNLDVMESSRTKKNKPSLAAKMWSAAKLVSAAEIEELFSASEKQEQKRFAEKYNFDIVKDGPLEGRYEWVRLKP